MHLDFNSFLVSRSFLISATVMAQQCKRVGRFLFYCKIKHTQHQHEYQNKLSKTFLCVNEAYSLVVWEDNEAHCFSSTQYPQIMLVRPAFVWLKGTQHQIIRQNSLHLAVHTWVYGGNMALKPLDFSMLQKKWLSDHQTYLNPSPPTPFWLWNWGEGLAIFFNFPKLTIQQAYMPASCSDWPSVQRLESQQDLQLSLELSFFHSSPNCFHHFFVCSKKWTTVNAFEEKTAPMCTMLFAFVRLFLHSSLYDGRLFVHLRMWPFGADTKMCFQTAN